MKQLIIFLFALMVGSSSVVAQTVDPVWIDVRTAEEHAESSISGHPNIPHVQIADRIDDLVSDKDATLYLYCATGRRAGVARETLEQLGYTNIVNVGGIADARECLEQGLSC
ncbi:MAG: rhodanese-like domain-containing protein [Gammaproteobacteria bacterium]